MKYLISVLVLASCSYSITQIHTEGQATDVVDENQTPTSTVSPNINLPITPKL